MITSWRITKKKYAAQAMTGEGAKLWGGRWNPQSTPAIYTSDSLALAILELIVHTDSQEDIMDYVAIPVQFASDRITTWPIDKLPNDWASLPISSHTQQFGKRWLDEKQSLIFKVPSAVVPVEYNFIINPLHPAFKSLKIGQPTNLQFDPRLSDRLF